MKRIVALLTLGFFWACQKPPDKGDYLVMESEPIRKSEILMSEITTNVQIIPLETSEKSLIQKIEKIVKKGGLYYIQDGSKRLLVFDANGKYLNTISGIGAGPGEYAYLKDFDVDPARNTIVIADLGKVHVYDLDGTYRNTLYIGGDTWNIFLLPDGKIARRNLIGDKLFQILDLEGNILGEYIDLSPNLRHRVHKHIEFFSIGDRVFSQDGVASNDLWCYQNGEVSSWKILSDPRCVSGEQENEYIRHGGLGYQQSNPDVMKIPSITSGRDFTMIFASVGKGGYLYLRNNRTGETKRFESWWENITDDLFFLDIERLMFNSSYTETEDQFVAFADAYLVADGLEKHSDLSGTDNYRRVESLLDSLGDIYNANPILVSFNFKFLD